MKESETAGKTDGARRPGGNGSNGTALGGESLVRPEERVESEARVKALRRAVVAMHRASNAELPSPECAFSFRPLEHPVDIVIPVFNAADDVRRCIESVIACAPASCRIVIVDDASTDPSVAEFLLRTAKRDARIVLLQNDVNCGFVKTANRGMRQAAGRDIVLLNSDTIVTEYFVERLQACVRADEFTGIATPLTNNGTICSVPRFCEDNPLPARHTVDSFAALLAATSLRLHPAIPSAVGFCMYIRHEVFEEISYFDEETFGRGYGEENDFCERAEAAGFLVRLCDDLFVYHKGSASFGTQASEKSKENQKTLAKKHPHYHKKIEAFIARNPLRAVHDNVRFALDHAVSPATRSLLVLIHTPLFDVQGGTEFHVRDIVANLGWERVVIAYPVGDQLIAAEVIGGQTQSATRYAFPLSHPAQKFEHHRDDIEQAIGAILDAFNVNMVHVHHLFNLPIAIWRQFSERRIPYVLTFHDYYPVCPSHNLIDVSTGRPCARCFDEPRNVISCVQPLLSSHGIPGEFESFMEEHRREFAGAILHAESVVFPSRAAKEIVGRAYKLNEPTAIVIEHGYDPGARKGSKLVTGGGGRIRVAFVGAISKQVKGAENHLDLISVLRDIETIEWHFFGDVGVEGYANRLLAVGPPKRLYFHGGYERETICDSLIDARIDLVVLLPIWPETFSFTLSEALSAGIPVIVANSGALGERIRCTRFGVAVDSVDEAASVLRGLASDPARLRDYQSAVRGFAHKSVSENAREYRRLYETILESRNEVSRQPRRLLGARALIRSIQAVRRQSAVARPESEESQPSSGTVGALGGGPGVLRYELADMLSNALKRRSQRFHGALKSMLVRFVSGARGPK